MATEGWVDAIPMLLDETGVFRVGSTRVPLDTVLDAFDDGATPEEIVLRYDAPALADVYQVIGYSLRHPTEIGAYRKRRRAAVEALRAEHPEWQPAGLRQRLLARRDARGLDHPSAGWQTKTCITASCGHCKDAHPTWISCAFGICPVLLDWRTFPCLSGQRAKIG